MPGIELTKNVFRVRQFDPKKCRQGSFRTLVISKNKGISLVRCVLKSTGKWATQTILFAKDKWDKSSIRRWIKDHGYVVLPENFESLFSLGKLKRKQFLYDLHVAQFWRDEYLKALEADSPDPSAEAWSAVFERYKREHGRWKPRK